MDLRFNRIEIIRNIEGNIPLEGVLITRVYEEIKSKMGFCDKTVKDYLNTLVIRNIFKNGRIYRRLSRENIAQESMIKGERGR